MYISEGSVHKPSRRKYLFIAIAILTAIGLSVAAFFIFFDSETPEEKVQNQISFEESVTEQEKSKILDVLNDNQGLLNDSVTLGVDTTETPEKDYLIIDAYVPVTTYNSTRQKVSTADLANTSVFVAEDTDPIISTSLSNLLNTDIKASASTDQQLTELTDDTVAFIPVDKLNSSLKLLTFNDSYYLDSFESGALFRTVSVNSQNESSEYLKNLVFTRLDNENSIFKVNMSGVTALTREMQKKLSSVKDPLYFSAKIGDFLGDADLTHVSNEVSFKPNCPYSYTLFCSPPEFIETLKASGVDLVELTGNHNNDLGSEFNTASINAYHELGWATVGGGINSEEAAKPYIADQKDSKVAFLAYNFPDSPNGGAIAGVDRAGANSFDFTYESIQQDIETAKETSDFVIVNIQYWECYSYPEGYLEFPICDKPIDGQEETFQKMIDLGADMVVGSSAHQPQTYRLYEGKPIYYGLGNLYFEQTQWPGTERGIILTHYFNKGELIQTKLTPTVFDRDLQTRIMTDEEADYLLNRLYDAR